MSESTQPPWWKGATVYQIYPHSFADSNDDGIGDLNGVLRHLDHLQQLGVDALWLSPIFRSPMADAGYDVSDYCDIDPLFGSLGDIDRLIAEAHARGIRVLLDFVPNHTSDQHPWFVESRRSRGSPKRDWYIWANEPDDSIEPIFATVEKSVWTRDEDAGQYYRHLFYHHEPDLNPGNPKVIEEIERIIAFWLRLGVSGFRVDAASHLIEQAGHGDSADGYRLLEHMRDFVTLRRPEAVLLGEVDVEPEEYRGYFGEGDRLTLLLNFWANNHFFLSLARSEAGPLQRAPERQPEPPERAQYAIWLLCAALSAR